MKIELRKCILNLNFHRNHLKIWVFPVLLLIMFQVNQIRAQTTISTDSAFSEPAKKDTSRKLFGGEITNFGYGGPAIKLSRINNQFAFMTGGRGGCTINSRYTLGGGGYGISNFIKLPGTSPDTTRYFKMGYGGLELGYLFFSGEKVNIGVSLLFAVGAAFWQSQPKSDNEKLIDDDFKIISVMEPSFYGEIALNRFMRLHTGISYRYVNGSDLAYIKTRDMNGFSWYIGLLFGK